MSFPSLRHSSCTRSIRHQLPASRSPLLYLALITTTHALPQQFGNTPPSSTSSTSSDSDDDDDDSGSSLSRDGMLNLYFLFIAIAVILLLIALFLIHRRKKRRKEIMRTFGQSALAQDINGGGGNNTNARAHWLHGNRWAAPHANPNYRPEEGLNERGEAPPPYSQPPGGPPQMPYAPPPHGHFAPQQQPPWQGDPSGLAIPMRTLSRDTQGSKPPEYADATSTTMGTPAALSASSSTGNLIRHDGQLGSGRP